MSNDFCIIQTEFLHEGPFHPSLALVLVISTEPFHPSNMSSLLEEAGRFA